MRRRGIATAAALMLLGAPAASPAQDAVALRDAPRATAVALAGRDVLVAGPHRDGAVAVAAVSRDTGAVRRLLTVPSPGKWWSSQVQLAASAERVAVLVAREDAEGHPRGWRRYGGPPAGPLVLEERGRRPTARDWIQYAVAVDGAQLLVAEARFGPFASRLRVAAPGAAPVPLPWPGAAMSPVALAGGRVAFVGERDPRSDRIGDVVVADAGTGAVVGGIPVDDPDDVGELDLDAAGRVVAEMEGRLALAALGAPPSLLPGRRWSEPRFAGGAVIGVRGGADLERPWIVDPATRALAPLGPPTTFVQSLDADAAGAAWLANGCLRLAPLDGVGPVPSSPPCPSAEVTLEEGDQALHGRWTPVHVRCVAAGPAGCRGTVVLRAEGPITGTGRFELAAGERRTVRVRFGPGETRRIRRTLRHAGLVFFTLRARVSDGRVSRHGSTGGAVVDRLAGEPHPF